MLFTLKTALPVLFLLTSVSAAGAPSPFNHIRRQDASVDAAASASASASASADASASASFSASAPAASASGVDDDCEEGDEYEYEWTDEVAPSGSASISASSTASGAIPSASAVAGVAAEDEEDCDEDDVTVDEDDDIVDDEEDCEDEEETPGAIPDAGANNNAGSTSTYSAPTPGSTSPGNVLIGVNDDESTPSGAASAVAGVPTNAPAAVSPLLLTP